MGITDVSINEKIALLRDKHDLSQHEMAETIGIPFRTYQNIEYGRTKEISIDVIIAVARAFDLSIDDFVGLKSLPKTAKQKTIQEIQTLLMGLDDHGLEVVKAAAEGLTKITQAQSTPRSNKS